MWELLVTIGLALITLSAIALQKTYGAIPAKELKRRAQKGDASAKALYRAVAYGLSLRVLLWLIVGLSTTGLFFVVIRTYPWPLALVGVLVIVWAGFAWLPSTKVTVVSRRLAQLMTPPLAWLLNYLPPVLERLGLMVRKHSKAVVHTRLYEAEDMVELLKQQEKQADNRVAKDEIEIAIHALTFGQKIVREHMTPLSQVKMVKITDSIGPLLMDDLHKSGHSRFPVYEGKKANLVGTLYVHDLANRAHGGTVKSILRPEVFYVHEEQTLYQTLQAFLKTKHHLYIVVNRFEEMVGIITVEDVIEQIIGRPIMDEFDQYEDLRAVAARMAEQEHAAHKHEVEPQKPAPEKSETAPPESDVQ
jgi:CBS domain containing-hemolysin-like protein